MGEKLLVILIVILTTIVMGIFTYKAYKKENYCSGCKRHKK